MFGADLIQKNEDQKDPDEEKKKEEERIKNKNLDKFAITNLTNKLSKNLATKFKLTHKNVDEDGKTSRSTSGGPGHVHFLQIKVDAAERRISSMGRAS